MARFLARQGYACLRFDFRGKGYSEGARESAGYRSMLSDLDTVIQSVNSMYEPTHIILIGICSGARTALSYHNFKGEVLLIHGEKDPEASTAMKQIKSLLQKYRIGYQDMTVKNANHSFYSLKWEKEIMDMVYNWLRKLIIRE